MRASSPWALAMVLSACSFDLGDHPSACRTNADCQDAYYCDRDLCVQRPSIVGESKDGGEAGSQSAGGAGGGAGTAGKQDGGGAGSGAVDAGPDAAGGGASGTDASNNDASTSQDAGLDGAAPVVPPYSACTDATDCNPGETCRKSGTAGVCAAPCSAVGDCDVPSGSYTAAPTCGADHVCRLDCAPSPPVPPFNRTCPAAGSCLMDTGASTKTCYPK